MKIGNQTATLAMERCSHKFGSRTRKFFILCAMTSQFFSATAFAHESSWSEVPPDLKQDFDKFQQHREDAAKKQTARETLITAAAPAFRSLQNFGFQCSAYDSISCYDKFQQDGLRLKFGVVLDPESKIDALRWMVSLTALSETGPQIVHITPDGQVVTNLAAATFQATPFSNDQISKFFNFPADNSIRSPQMLLNRNPEINKWTESVRQTMNKNKDYLTRLPSLLLAKDFRQTENPQNILGTEPPVVMQFVRDTMSALIVVRVERSPGYPVKVFFADRRLNPAAEGMYLNALRNGSLSTYPTIGDFFTSTHQLAELDELIKSIAR